MFGLTFLDLALLAPNCCFQSSLVALFVSCGITLWFNVVDQELTNWWVQVIDLLCKCIDNKNSLGPRRQVPTMYVVFVQAGSPSGFGTSFEGIATQGSPPLLLSTTLKPLMTKSP